MLLPTLSLSLDNVHSPFPDCFSVRATVGGTSPTLPKLSALLYLLMFAPSHSTRRQTGVKRSEYLSTCLDLNCVYTSKIRTSLGIASSSFPRFPCPKMALNPEMGVSAKAHVPYVLSNKRHQDTLNGYMADITRALCCIYRNCYYVTFEWAVCAMASFYYQDQNAFWFLVLVERNAIMRMMDERDLSRIV